MGPGLERTDAAIYLQRRQCGGQCERERALSSSESVAVAPGRTGLIAALAVLALAAAVVVALVLLLPARHDPYTRSSLTLAGDAERGGRLFLINCAGCHGIAGQGLVGPRLQGVDQRRSDVWLIRQVTSGRTPPMPRFQPDPQAMADLLAHLHTLH